MSLRSFLAGVFLASPLLATMATADMGQVHVSLEGATVSESAQKAIILHNNREEVLILGTELQASQQTPIIRFIPFPTEPQVSLAPRGVFERLAGLVAKYKLQYVFTYFTKGGPPSQKQTGVEVHFSARLGAHDLTVIRVREAAGFRAWVNGYFRKKGLPYHDQYRDAEAIVADYVARGIDYFVLDAVELSVEKRFVDPVVYRFATTSLYYPLKTSNTFGGKGEIELFIAAPTTLCAPDSFGAFEPFDKAINAAGHVTGDCLNMRVEASTSAMLVPEEHDLESIYPAVGGFFGGKPVYLQAIRYVGDYHFDSDVLVPLPQGVAKALDAPEPDEGDFGRWGVHLMVGEYAQCRKVPEKGPCKGLFEMYYFDGQSRSCKPFYWGGCQGEVPFKTREDCEKTCPSQWPPGNTK